MAMVCWILLRLQDTTVQERTDDRQSPVLCGFNTLPKRERHFRQHVTHASSTIESSGEAPNMWLDLHDVPGAARLAQARSDRLQTFSPHGVFLLNVNVRGQSWSGIEQSRIFSKRPEVIL